jgi:hypothetical protein
VASSPSRSLAKATEVYASRRRAVFEFIRREFSAYSVEASEITLADAREADSWKTKWPNPSRAATWSWEVLYRDYHRNDGIKRFDLAVRIGGRLQLLCYGLPNNSRLILKLHAIERGPERNPLRGRVLEIALSAAIAYARLIGSQELWICNPVSTAHVRMYSAGGFTPHTGRDGAISHLSMRLDP